MPKYEYIFHVKYTEAILSNSIAARGSEGVHKLPSGSESILVHFRHKFAPFRLLSDDRVISCVYCPIKEYFRDIFAKFITPTEKKVFEHANRQPLWAGEL